jgi:hypothetical protein
MLDSRDLGAKGLLFYLVRNWVGLSKVYGMNVQHNQPMLKCGSIIKTVWLSLL